VIHVTQFGTFETKESDEDSWRGVSGNVGANKKKQGRRSKRCCNEVA